MSNPKPIYVTFGFYILFPLLKLPQSCHKLAETSSIKSISHHSNHSSTLCSSHRRNLIESSQSWKTNKLKKSLEQKTETINLHIFLQIDSTMMKVFPFHPQILFGFFIGRQLPSLCFLWAPRCNDCRTFAHEQLTMANYSKKCLQKYISRQIASG